MTTKEDEANEIIDRMRTYASFETSQDPFRLTPSQVSILVNYIEWLRMGIAHERKASEERERKAFEAGRRGKIVNWEDWECEFENFEDYKAKEGK